MWILNQKSKEEQKN